MKFITILYRHKKIRILIPVIGFCLLAAGVVFLPKGTTEKPVDPVQQIELKSPQAASETAKIRVHTVSNGETIGSIAENYSIDVETLQGANDNLTADIHPGDKVSILPSKGVLHTADMGDTLWRIANLYSIDVNAIMTANGKADEHLSIGEKLFIPGGKKPQSTERQLARAEVPVSRGVSERFVWPAAGSLSSAFGYRWGREHNGIDLANDVGTQIRAARSGRVVYAGWYSGYGYSVVIEHEQGYSTLYGHLNDYSVQKGQYVKGGQMIAYMGNSGNSTGPHLHFEIRKDGTPINPHNMLP
ncbi:MAG: peptidoglycan DD-metalloendopeptidase family protein [Sporomusaceae bacterium]|nr:peptidoglycan DD-metalloendopeptidase family protein [Sporomusaceae bacterium]